MNMNLLMQVLWYEDCSPSDLARELGLTAEAFFKKVIGEDDFSLSEINKIVALFGLSNEEVDRIFFTESGPKVI